MNQVVERNLFFKVDFNGKYKKTKEGIRQVVKFYLIGVLPVVIIYADDHKERAIIQYPLEVHPDKQEPKKIALLRLLNKAKYKEMPKIKKAILKQFKINLSFDKETKKILLQMQKTIGNIIKTSKFRDKKIKNILLDF